ncbi:MAG: von Willebrand factor type A domain-containing protein [Pirellulaceae bacterium]|nr:von Willebrand factor type A domain-containing protein [Pirellulaceae bacterium]
MNNNQTHSGSDQSDDLTAQELTAYALGQLEVGEAADIERLLADPTQAEARRIVAETRRLAAALPEGASAKEGLARSPELREAVLKQLAAEPAIVTVIKRPTSRQWLWLEIAAGLCAAILIMALLMQTLPHSREAARVVKRLDGLTSRDENSITLEIAKEDHLEEIQVELENQLTENLTMDADPPTGVSELRTDLSSSKNTAAQLGPYSGTGVAASGGHALRGKMVAATGGNSRAEAEAVQYAERVSQTEFDARQSRLLASRNGEQYAKIVENRFLAPADHPLSTFSIDVDTASYANVRRFLTSGRLPPPAAVRIEELVNYFTYSYPQPKGAEPFSVNMEVAESPWREGALLVRVGLKGKEIQRTERPASNLTFLLDVSGSMADQNKLPLVKTALAMFVGELTENDRVSIVTYAGDAGLRLAPTSGDQKQKIMAAIDSLSAGGSTHGSAGIQLAYEQAAQYFIQGGTNRVILATDGDLNVGVTSDAALVELIKAKAVGGTFLTVLGFGEGNLKDAKMEGLADNGNGMYAYIDSVREARKVLVEQMTGSTIAIAKDVKIQIEFNPAQVAQYRLLGYENRVLAAKDFNDDRKDAGEIGAGHTVTALYEIIPVGAAAKPSAEDKPAVEPLKYQENGVQGSKLKVQGSQGDPTLNLEPGTLNPARLTDAAASGELLTLKLRYKQPEGETSKLLEMPLKVGASRFNAASKDLQFAAAVASFGMILRGSEHRGTGNLAAVAEIASGSLGEDAGGYRAEFVDLVRKAQVLGVK